jgi:glycosyltransferase involved in cell wall biosynthesis
MPKRAYRPFNLREHLVPLYPPISAICLTYGRPHLLEEAIYSFLKQDYLGRKELIVLNDFDQQTLMFNHPEITIVNTAERYPSLGEKRNAAMALAQHDLLMVWDDDDICLPHRISISVDRIRNSHGYFKQGSHALQVDFGIIKGIIESCFHCSSTFTRKLFDEVGGYPSIGRGEDVAFEQAIAACIGYEHIASLSDVRDYFYLYRWGTDSYHASWFEDSPEQSGATQITNYLRESLINRPLPEGIIALHPRWHADYSTMSASYIQQRTNA